MMKFLLCPIEIAGYMGRLKEGLKNIGCEARFYDLSNNKYEYPGADRTNLIDFYQRLNIISSGKPLFLQSAILYLVRFVLRFIFFLDSIMWADVIIFSFGRTFLGGLELPVYKLFGKTLIFLYLGSDSRPPYLNGASVSKSRGKSLDECFEKAKRLKKRITWLDQFADYIIDNPVSGVFHERPFIPFLRMGIPIPVVHGVQKVSVPMGKTVILHAPTFPECKGTDKIREMISQLCESYPSIEYVELIGKTNSEVLKELERCDFVIDQLYSDTILAGLGTEAARFGKATIVGSYVEEEQYFVSSEYIPPAYVVYPEDVYNTLVHMIEAPDEVKNVGLAAKQFILEEWSAEAVAVRYLDLVQGKMEERDFCNPSKIKKSTGWGFDQTVLRSYLRAYLGKYGTRGLFLDDKPALQASMLKMAGL